MKICVDFDGTVVDRSGYENDTTEPLEFAPGAQATLYLLAQSHTVILSSARANTALRLDWRRNPLWRNDPDFDVERWELEKVAHQARYEHMLAFVEENLPGVFAFIDDGSQGKILADLYLDDEGLRMNGGWLSADWSVVEQVYGVPNVEDGASQEVHERSDVSGAGTREVGLPD